MEQGNGYLKGLIIGSLAGGLIGVFAALFYGSKRGKSLRKGIKNKTGEYYDETTKLLTDAKIKATDMLEEGKKIIKEVKSKADSIISNVKEDNALQINIMGTAGIPKEEMHKYALSSVADGKILREYVNEIKSGEITPDEAVEKVKIDYEKMKSGKKEGKFVTPSKSKHKDSPN